ncbi:MAG TPA: 2-oxoglutarate dehydrogenase complex dihydrolipoyllysine-residue succinyltransferase [Candidatus Tenderia sp.]|nr:2-oxoglutarate dehydrogenase complex dihydrolipoyllysine-residue succinyltransferase [Candidatus Tenderia sp.]
MAIEVKVPVLSESIADATLAQWHKQPGDFVKQDEILVDVETDKVMLEVVAPEDGVLMEIKRNNGETVASAEVIALIDTEAKAPAPAVSDEVAEVANAAKPAAEKTSETTSAAAALELSPAVRRLVAENSLDASAIPATGRGGRLTKADVVKFMAQGEKSAVPASAAPSTVETGVGARPEQRVPMTRLRARIAERLVEAQQTAAMLTSFNEVDMQPVMDLRARYKESFEKKHGTKLGFMSFFIKACVEALKEFPAVNASIDGGDIIYHGYFDVGVAVSTERGLVVPIIRDVDQCSMAELEQSVVNYATKAREGKLAMEDLTGGTFSITNGGVFGSLLSTPILNPPQSAILGMHKIEQRPVVVDGEIVIRPMMYVALTYDHRIIDGREAVSFLVKVKNALEDPARMLLQV